MKHWHSLPEMFLLQASERGERILFRFKKGGVWQAMAWDEAASQLWQMTNFLCHKFLSLGGRGVIVGENSPYWAIADLAIMNAGGVSVPLYLTHSKEDHLYCLDSVGAEVVFASPRAMPSLGEALLESSSVKKIIVLDEKKDKFSYLSHRMEILSWREACLQGQNVPPVAKRVLTEDGISSIIHTSGTSSHPKGVMLSHKAILSNCAGASHLLHSIGLRNHRIMSFLPLAHAFERTCCQFFPMTLGDAEIIYAEDIEHLVQNMAEMHPTLLAAVPRLYQAMEHKLMVSMEKNRGIKGFLLRETWRMGHCRIKKPLKLWQKLYDGFLNLMVRRSVRKRFGGCMRVFISGGAALPLETHRNLDAFGLTILQGYGQTEAAPIISCSLPDDNRLGMVGPAFKNVTVRVSEDGELCVRGDGLMQGYWQDEEASGRVLRDGWLYTGDGGSIDGDGMITITDRLKDMIVTSGGDNISPQKIEEKLCRQNGIHQAAVFGDGKNFLVAILVMEHDFQGKSQDAIDEANKQLQPFERIKRFIMADEAFTIANKLMTPTLKVRRRAIKSRYQKRLDALYGSH